MSRPRTCLRSSKQESQECQVNELKAGVEQSLAGLPQPPVLLQPCKAAFDDPALGHLHRDVLALNAAHALREGLAHAAGVAQQLVYLCERTCNVRAPAGRLCGLSPRPWSAPRSDRSGARQHHHTAHAVPQRHALNIEPGQREVPRQWQPPHAHRRHRFVRALRPPRHQPQPSLGRSTPTRSTGGSRPAGTYRPGSTATRSPRASPNDGF